MGNCSCVQRQPGGCYACGERAFGLFVGAPNTPIHYSPPEPDAELLIAEREAIKAVLSLAKCYEAQGKTDQRNACRAFADRLLGIG